MPTGKPKYYWDACIFIAWIKDEPRTAGQMEGIEEMAKRVDVGQAVVMTSVITRTEVLEATLNDAQKGKFEALLKRKFIQPIACDMRVADRAHEIRSYYKAKSMIMDTPDSIHLATALLYQADCFYTFDGESKKKRANRAKLTSLNGNVAGSFLRIEIPWSPPGLLTGVPSGFKSRRGTEPSDALLKEKPDDAAPAKAPDKPKAKKTTNG